MSSGDDIGGETHFGYRTVPVAAKTGLVRRVFEDVAGRYDLMNDLMSLGVHRLWRQALMDTIRPRPADRILDLAGGTADIALRMLRRMGETPPAQPITVSDINGAMLAVGRQRAAGAGRLDDLRFVEADAENLPFEAMSFDVVTIAFGLRNVTRPEKALAEAFRVLAPGGRFFCLELSHVAVPILARAYDAYSFAVLPRLGRLVTSNPDAYQYLAESIRRFPPQEALARLMRKAGFERVRYRDFSAGIAALHSGWKL